MKVPHFNSRFHITELKIIKILMIKIKDVLCIAIIYIYGYTLGMQKRLNFLII